ncbi:MAG: RluA family pseudouridine synthase [Gallicola sp.]|nr:RluA family pseudouridine synthase [Gallicola sp.]
MKELKFIIKDGEGSRLDLFLSKNIENISRSKLQKIIKESVFVNEKKRKPNYKVQKDDIIRIQLPEEEMKIQKENSPLDIRYEDEDLLILFKPKGKIVHPTDSVRENTVVNALLYRFDQLSNLSGEERPGIVHRLDKDTTGLLIIAKNNEIHEKLQILFKERKIKKIYYALCNGDFSETEGDIYAPIGRNPNKRTEMAVNGLNSKEAHTSYRIVWNNDNYSLAEIHLDTGRTHQIRVHMKYIHHPIVGDPVYGLRKEKLKVSSQLLSACRLEFIHPNTGEKISIQSVPDEEFMKVLEKLGCCYFK